MKIIANKLNREEGGQALILTMILLLVGTLIIAPLLGFMSTGLLAGQVFEERMTELYAADAGVEDALWQLINNPPASYPYSYSLPDVNEMSVSVLIEEVTTLYGVFVGGGGIHEDWLELGSELVVYEDPDGDGTGVYTWRLSLTNKHNSNISIHSITVSYNMELSYLSGGLDDEDVAGLVKGSFNDGTPTEVDAGSKKLTTWEFEPPRPQIDGAPDPDNGDYTTVTCTFELVGPEDAEGITAYLVTSRSDIGTVWEYEPMKITATVQADDGSTMVIEAGVLQSSSALLVGSWQIE